MKKSNEYWKANFTNEKIVNATNDLHINIARTKNGEAVSEDNWNKTIQYILNLLDIRKDSIVTELCCGNGLIIGEIAKNCKEAFGVDYSEILLNQLNKNFVSNNLSTINADVNKYILGSETYDSIIIYFSLQHFNEQETFLLINKCIAALKPQGKILIGDIPDLDKKWQYIDMPNHHKDYFRRVQEEKPMIGYWFQKDFFKAMNSCFPSTKFEILQQPSYQINSDHRFDLLIRKV
jgi:cyclopropane fatty-acyl-phospholipid synthase-like methyltransferase